MSVLVNVILGVQMLTALGMIGLILVQHGKGADMGAAFGSGSSGSLFGARQCQLSFAHHGRAGNGVFCGNASAGLFWQRASHRFGQRAGNASRCGSRCAGKWACGCWF